MHVAGYKATNKITRDSFVTSFSITLLTYNFTSTELVYYICNLKLQYQGTYNFKKKICQNPGMSFYCWNRVLRTANCREQARDFLVTKDLWYVENL